MKRYKIFLSHMTRKMVHVHATEALSMVRKTWEVASVNFGFTRDMLKAIWCWCFPFHLPRSCCFSGLTSNDALSNTEGTTSIRPHTRSLTSLHPVWSVLGSWQREMNHLLIHSDKDDQIFRAHCGSILECASNLVTCIFFMLDVFLSPKCYRLK